MTRPASHHDAVRVLLLLLFPFLPPHTDRAATKGDVPIRPLKIGPNKESDIDSLGSLFFSLFPPLTKFDEKLVPFSTPCQHY